MGVRMSVIQLDCSDTEAPESRIDRVMGILDQLAGTTDLVLLPELWNAGAFDLNTSKEIAQPIDGPLPTALSNRARQLGMWIHGGSFCEQDGDHLYNTSVVFNDSGELVAKYRKVHVFTYAREQDTMTPGHEYVVVPTPLGLTGLATCYDARFPEMFRAMREAGAQAFLIPSGWPTQRIGQWNAVLPARAVENQAWVIANNQVGRQGSHILGGNSAVIDPLGVVHAHAGDTEEIFTVEIDPELATKWREEFPAVNDIVTKPVVVY
jgi:predicted amidohydrolase